MHLVPIGLVICTWAKLPWSHIYTHTHTHTLYSHTHTQTHTHWLKCIHKCTHTDTHTHTHTDYRNTLSCCFTHYACVYFHEHNIRVHVHTHIQRLQEHTVVLVRTPLCMCILSWAQNLCTRTQICTTVVYSLLEHVPMYSGVMSQGRLQWDVKWNACAENTFSARDRKCVCLLVSVIVCVTCI